MSYGHAQTGKSHTMDNLTASCLAHIFDHKNHTVGGRDKNIFVSVFEMFKESIHDLISGSTDVTLKSAPLSSGVDILGLQERVKYCTGLINKSSRT